MFEGVVYRGNTNRKGIRVAVKPKGVKDICPKQIEQILKYSEENRSKLTPLLRFLILTTFRINEALTFTTKNIDDENSYIHIRGKGDKPATIPLLSLYESYKEALNRIARVNTSLSQKMLYTDYFRG